MLKRCWSSIAIVAALLTLASCLRPVFAEAQPNKRIALFAQRASGDPFWTMIERFMQAACHDLGMELTVYYAENDRGKMLRNVKNAVAAPQKPDALVFPNLKEIAPDLIKVADQARVPAILINSGVSEAFRAEIGLPKEKFPFWIGQILPDDVGAGAELARLLIETAKQRGNVGADGLVHLFGITGTISDMASKFRAEGLEQAVEQRTDAALHQVVPANWDQVDAKQRFIGLMGRYPATTVVWAASDLMAIGIAEGSKEHNLPSGQPIVTGGVDWTSEGIAAVQSGQLVASMGGHFMEGGWAAVVFYDYFQGVEAAQQAIDVRSPMIALTKENLDAYLQFQQADWEQIDFKAFSKAATPGVTEYDFRFDAVLKQLGLPK